MSASSGLLEAFVAMTLGLFLAMLGYKVRRAASRERMLYLAAARA